MTETINNIKDIIQEVETGRIELENFDPSFHEVDYTDGACSIYIVHSVEGQEGLEVLFAEHSHIEELRQLVYEG